MKYVELGTTGRKVSRICLGTMTWGQQNSEADAHAQIDLALDMGVDFIDAAEMYPVPPKKETYGRTEEYLGTWLAKNKAKRDKVVVATKVASRSMGNDHIRPGQPLNEASIRAAVEASLKRLQTDYIDLYQAHSADRPANRFGVLDYAHKEGADQGASLAETAGAMEKLVKEGKIRCFGVSNETPWGLLDYLRAADKGRGARIASIQNPYSLLNRSFEIGLAEIAIKEKVGLLAYSVLGMGVLTGKYFDGAKPANARLTMFERFKRYSTPRAEPAAKQYVAAAREAGLDPAQLAVAFVASQPFVTAAIVGATSVEQLKTNIAAIDVAISPELRAKLDAIHAGNPNPCP
ncbi:MAG: NADP(H)-dependent aldo-keto reductase [Alphaproteobacteria bacterium]|nr:NADP(H)-dependent aldo-keto reductase [Alphaproteobacteria bacterium]